MAWSSFVDTKSSHAHPFLRIGKARALLATKIVLGLVLCLFAGCKKSGDDDAQRMFNQATALLDEAREAETRSYDEAEGLYVQGLDYLEQLQESHGSTAISWRMKLGEEKATGYTVSELRGRILPQIRSKARAERNFHEAASRFADRISNDPDKRVRALNKLAESYIKQANKQEAREILEESLLESKKVKDPMRGLDLKIKISRLYAQNGMPREERRILDKAKDSAESARLGVERVRRKVLLCGALAESGRIEPALEVARGIDHTLKDYALGAVAVALAGQGDARLAKDVAQGIRLERPKIEALVNMAGALVEAGGTESSWKLLSQSAALLKKYDVPSTVALNKARMAEIYAKTGKTKKAESILGEALVLARKNEDFDMRFVRELAVRTLVSLSSAYTTVGAPDQGWQAGNDARALIHGFSDPHDRVRALIGLAEVSMEVRDEDAAKKALRKAVQQASKVKNPDWGAETGSATVGIVRNYAKLGDFETALKVVMAIDDSGYRAISLAEIAATYTMPKKGMPPKLKELMHQIVEELD